MKSRHIFLLQAILIFSIAVVAVTSGQEDIRDRLNPYYTPEKWSLPDSVIGRDFSVFTTVIDTDFEPAGCQVRVYRRQVRPYDIPFCKRRG